MGRHQRDQREVKYSKECSKKITVEEARIRNLKVFKADFCDLKTKILKTENMIVDGLDLSTLLSGTADTGITSGFDAVACDPATEPFGCYTPEKKEEVNQAVFDGLLVSGKAALDSLQQRVDAGRARLNLAPSPGFELVGSITLPTSYRDDPANADVISFITGVGWNLEIANSNSYNEDNKPATLIVSSFSQIGWIDSKTGLFKSVEISSGNKQLSPTIDYVFDPDFKDVTSWGEKYASRTVIDTQSILDAGETGTFQVLLFREMGLTVYFPDEAGTCGTDFPECRVNTAVTNCKNNCSIDITQSNEVNTTYGVN